MSNTHFSGPLSIGSDSYESLITTKQLDGEDNGKTFGLNLANGFTVTLPAIDTIKPGWVARFRIEISPTTSYLINKHADDGAIILGSFNTSTGETNPADFETGGMSVVSLVGSTAVVGDWVAFETNGTNWFAYGQSTVPLALTFT